VERAIAVAGPTTRQQVAAGSPDGLRDELVAVHGKPGRLLMRPASTEICSAMRRLTA
jgi:hypothetical protein